MSFENERYVSSRVDRIKHLEERIEMLEKSIASKERMYEDLLKDYIKLQKQLEPKHLGLKHGKT